MPPATEIHSASFSMTKSGYNVEMVQDRRKMPLEYDTKTMVARSTGDVTSGLARLLETDIDENAVFYCRRKWHITFGRYTIDPKRVLNTIRKPKSIYRYKREILHANLFTLGNFNELD
jgi:hypothetical protein